MDDFCQTIIFEVNAVVSITYLIYHLINRVIKDDMASLDDSLGYLLDTKSSNHRCNDVDAVIDDDVSVYSSGTSNVVLTVVSD